MDITIQIEARKIVTALYAKSLALYQYIPPNFCHPPGILTGLVYGQILQIHWLCFKNGNIKKEIQLFYKHLVDRGYLRMKLLPIFEKVIDDSSMYILLMIPEQQEARKKSKLVAPSFFKFPTT